MSRPCQLALILALTIMMAVGSTPPRARAEGTARFGLQPVTYNPDVPAGKSYFVFDAQPGASVESKVRVINTGAARGTVRLYPVDATTGQTSGTVFLERDAPQKDTGTWITLDSVELTLDPGESSVVPFRVVVPADVTPGHHIAGIVAEAAKLQENKTGNAAPDTAAFQVNIKNLTILAVQLNLPGPVIEQVAVGNVTPGGSGGYQTLLVAMRNEGTVMVKPTGTITVTDTSGQELQRIPLNLDTFLPRTEIQYPVAVQRQALGAGQYRARVELTYGTGGTTSYQGDFTITQAQVSQVFQAPAPLAPPPSIAAPGTAQAGTNAATPWPLIAGGGAALLVVLLAGIVIGRRRTPSGSSE